MKHSLFIDPGISADNGTGWAYFASDGAASWLVHCGIVQSVASYPLPLKCEDIVKRVERAAAIRELDLLVVEHMRVYPIARMKGDPNDLLELAYLEGSFQLLKADAVKLVPARDWKGQVPKKIVQERISRSLHDAERVIVHNVTKGLNAKEAANVWDACGIGLHVLRSHYP